jgi:hypothetical protein
MTVNMGNLFRCRQKNCGVRLNLKQTAGYVMCNLMGMKGALYLSIRGGI